MSATRRVKSVINMRRLMRARRKHSRAGTKLASITCQGEKANVQPKLCQSLSDDGRRTTSHSEFELSIRPDALGVMLRRRLDLQYPNQKADRLRRRCQRPKNPIGKRPALGTRLAATRSSSVIRASFPKRTRKQHVELMPPAHIVQTSNRRWRDDEFLLPPRLTRGRDKIRVRCEFVPVE